MRSTIRLVGVFLFLMIFDGISTINAQNLILNGDFDDMNGCPANPSMCAVGHIGTCVDAWAIDHGTPHPAEEQCIEGPNSFVICSSRWGGLGEGFFQLFDFEPNTEYNICFYVKTITGRSGYVQVSLANRSKGLSTSCNDTPGKRRVLLNEPLDPWDPNWPGWQRKTLTFRTPPLPFVYDRVVFSASQGGPGWVGFDNIYMTKTGCENYWNISQPGFVIPPRIHQRKKYITINSTNPLIPITNSISNEVELLAGEHIEISPGFIGQSTGNDYLLLKINDCGDGIIKCGPYPCTDIEYLTEEGSNQYNKTKNINSIGFGEETENVSSQTFNVSLSRNVFAHGENNSLEASIFCSTCKVKSVKLLEVTGRNTLEVDYYVQQTENDHTVLEIDLPLIYTSGLYTLMIETSAGIHVAKVIII